MHIDGLVQDCTISIAKTLEILQFVSSYWYPRQVMIYADINYMKRRIFLTEMSSIKCIFKRTKNYL